MKWEFYLDLERLTRPYQVFCLYFLVVQVQIGYFYFYSDLLDDLLYIITFLPPFLFLAIPRHYATACRMFVILPQL